MNNKKILIVTHQFLPHVSPRTTRWKMIIDDLIERGNQVTILTGTPPDDSVKNYDILYFGNKKISSTISSIRKDANNNAQNTAIKNFVYNSLKKLYRFLFKTFSWPDYAMFWAYTIYKNKKKIPKNYDYIFSVSLPFTSHLCGSILSKHSSDWIMDIGDPFSLKKDSPENNRFLYSSINTYFEKKYYKKSKRIIFTHYESLLFHQENFNLDPKKLIIGHPISKIDLNKISLSEKYNYSDVPVKIGYFGIFTEGIREPTNYLNSICKDLEIDFHHYWYTNNESKKYFISYLNNKQHTFNNLVPRTEAIDLMINSMHILLSIGNTNTYQLPSKVIEYISLGKPVLHFAEISNDPMYKFQNLFSNLKIINRNTQKDDLHEFLQNFQLQTVKLNIDNFENNFSSKSIIENLNSSLHDK